MKGHKGHHHKARKAGGRTDMLVSGNPDVIKEAEEKKHGGKVKGKHVGHMDGKAAHHRMDRRGRKSGGRVGADKAPLSSANKVSSAAKDGETAGGRPD